MTPAGSQPCATCGHYRVPALMSAICLDEIAADHPQVREALDSARAEEHTVVTHERQERAHGGFHGFWHLPPRATPYCALHADRDLRLLVSAPAGQAVRARFHLRATVRMEGVAGMIPLLARSGDIEGTYRLDSGDALTS